MTQTIDPYTFKHLDEWLEHAIYGDIRRDLVRERMLAFIAQDPEYYGAQSWWLVFDQSGCREIAY